MKNYYKITNLTVLMDTFGRTAAQAAPYLYEPEKRKVDAAPQAQKVDEAMRADIVIRSRWQALQEQQPHLSDEDCEYLSTGSSFYRQLLQFDGMMLHASAVVLDDRAYLFSAPSGTGKSTHTQLWLKEFGERAYILNDDKPALRREGGKWYAYGTPWSGKFDISRNERVPLAGICYLQRAEKNEIRPMQGQRAVHHLLEQTVRPAQAALSGRLLTLLDQLLWEVPVWEMDCNNMEPGAALVSHAAMKERTKSHEN